MALLTSFANLTVANLITTNNAGIGNLDIDGANIVLSNTASEFNITVGSQTGGRVQVNPNTSLSYVHAVAPSVSQQTYDNTNGFTSASWVTNGLEGTIIFTGATQSFQNWINSDYGSYNTRTVSINNDQVTGIVVTGWSVNSGISQITLFVTTPPTVDPTTVTQVTFVNVFNSELLLDNDEGLYQLQAEGSLVIRTIFNNDIELSAGDDIFINGGDKGITQGSEGGDVRINGGNGSPDDGNDSAGSGGDITVTGGSGGTANVFGAGAGGTVIINAGQGGSASNSASAGSGGFIELNAGVGGPGGGNTALGAPGGNVNITAGDSTLELSTGGNVNITTGSAGPNGVSGSVNLVVAAGGTSNGATWTFGGNGILSLPGGILVDSSDNNFEVRNVNNVNFEAAAQLNIYTDNGNNQWRFEQGGVFRVPGEGVIKNVDDTVILQTQNSVSNIFYNARLGTNGGWYLETSQYPNGWLYITNNTGDANIDAPSGNINVKPAFGVTNSPGKSLNLRGGDADQSDFYTGTGGAVNIIGGLGSSNDGGGGGPGGNVNLTAGTSSDPAGHAGNINIASGNKNWIFDYTGNLTVPGNVIANAGGASPSPSLSGFSSLSSIDSITTDGTITALRDVVKNGDDATGSQNKSQIQFGWNNTTQYSHYITTRHNNGNANNSILFYTSDGTANATFPANTVLGLTVNSGKVGVGNVAFPGNTLDVGGSIYATGNLSVSGNTTLTGNITANTGINPFAIKSSDNADKIVVDTTGVDILTALTLPAVLAQAGPAPATASDTTIAFKIPIVINGVTYYLALTAAQ